MAHFVVSAYITKPVYICSQYLLIFIIKKNKLEQERRGFYQLALPCAKVAELLGPVCSGINVPVYSLASYQDVNSHEEQ